jgi:hypothetical protein
VVAGVHGGEKIGGGFVVWAVLSGDPMEAKAVAEAAEHSHEEHGAGCAHAAEVVEVADVEAVVESAFDAPGLAVELESYQNARDRQRYRAGVANPISRQDCSLYSW